MQFLDRIDAIEKRAQAVNLSLWRLCRAAKVDSATIHRWRNGESSPMVRTLDKYVAALEREITKVETDMRQRLDEAAQSSGSRTAA